MRKKGGENSSPSKLEPWTVSSTSLFLIFSPYSTHPTMGCLCVTILHPFFPPIFGASETGRLHFPLFQLPWFVGAPYFPCWNVFQALVLFSKVPLSRIWYSARFPALKCACKAHAPNKFLRALEPGYALRKSSRKCLHTRKWKPSKALAQSNK